MSYTPKYFQMTHIWLERLEFLERLNSNEMNLTVPCVAISKYTKYLSPPRDSVYPWTTHITMH